MDENGCPVIIEYKRSSNENVINQGLFYLDWLLDHKAEFELLVTKQLGAEEAESMTNGRVHASSVSLVDLRNMILMPFSRLIEISNSFVM